MMLHGGASTLKFNRTVHSFC